MICKSYFSLEKCSRNIMQKYTERLHSSLSYSKTAIYPIHCGKRKGTPLWGKTAKWNWMRVFRTNTVNSSLVTRLFGTSDASESFDLSWISSVNGLETSGIFRKEETSLYRDIPNFSKITVNFRSIWFRPPSRNFRSFDLNGSHFGNRRLSGFSESIQTNFHPISPCFQNSGRFG